MSEREPWRDRAACRGLDAEVFFDPLEPDAGAPRAEWASWREERGVRRARARGICDGCPVRESCAESAAIDGEPLGIWGGLAPRQRQQLRTDLERAGRCARRRTCERCGRVFESRRPLRYCPDRACAEKVRQAHYARMELQRGPRPDKYQPHPMSKEARSEAWETVWAKARAASVDKMRGRPHAARFVVVQGEPPISIDDYDPSGRWCGGL